MDRHPRGFSRTLLLLCIAGLCASSCRTPEDGATSKDIATNSSANGTASGVYIYFREGQSVSRTRCPDGLFAANYDRDHCTETKQSVPAKPFFDGISVGVGDSIDLHSKNVQDLYAGVGKVQNQLLVILAAIPTVQTQVDALKKQLTDSDTQIAAVQVSISDCDHQITAIKAKLAVKSDVDLTMQLGKLLDQRNALLTKLNQAKANEQSNRDAFIGANSSSLDQDSFNDIEAQKNMFSQQLHDEQLLLASAMQEVADLNKAIAHVSDPTFTIDVLEGQQLFNGLKPFTQRFQTVFEQLYAGVQADEAKAAAAKAAEKAAADAAAKAAADAAAKSAAEAAAIKAAQEKAAAEKAAIEAIVAQAAANFHPAASQVSAGENNTCAVANGKVSCWGDDKLTPPADLVNVTQVATGVSHACAISGGTVTCWGDNAWGRAQPPAGLTNVTQIAVSGSSSCAVASGSIRCWGFSASHGFSNGVDILVSTPALANVTQIGVGSDFACALAAGKVTCWGDDGDGKTKVPAGLANVTQIAVAPYHTCALSGGAITCWGDNASGQTNVPANLGSASLISAGRFESCALVNGSMACWGDTDQAPPGLGNITAISPGWNHTCVLANNQARCWGNIAAFTIRP